MSALTLSRIQFAFTVGYHFLFVPLSLGLALMVVIAERRYYKSGIPADREASNFWIRLFTTTFAIGVATGITMEFAFGTNWASYSRFVGNIFGAPLAAEGIFSFFLESTFLGVLLFGRKRVSRRLYYAAAWLVAFGAHLSALWIIIANSWQQTPRGFKVEHGKALLTSFWHAAFNPSTAPRFVHTVVATWIAGSFLVAGISAWYLLKGRHVHFARRWLRTALIVGVVASVAMPVIGDWHAKEVAAQQPIKLAAFEGIYSSETDAPLTVIGYVDSKAHKTIGIRIPGLLSFLSYGSTSDEVTGLTSVPANDRPPEQIVFQSYHLMVGLGMLFALLMIVALALDLLKQLEPHRWLLRVLVWAIPFPVLAILLGWVAAEVGRQPWVVQGLLRTSQGVSPVVSAAEVGLTLGIFFVIYALLFAAWFRIFTNLIRKGPQDVAETLTARAESATVDEAGPATAS